MVRIRQGVSEGNGMEIKLEEVAQVDYIHGIFISPFSMFSYLSIFASFPNVQHIKDVDYHTQYAWFLGGYL